MRSPGIALAVLASLALAHPAGALDIPQLRGRVNDNAGMLTPQERSALEAKLQAYEEKTGQQFVLLTVPSLEGNVIEDFSIKVVEKWKLGDAKADDGLLMVISLNDRKMRIEVGYGLEGSVPDAIGARVIREVLAPAFRTGAYAQGIDQAFSYLMRAASGELPASELRERPQRERRPATLWGVLSPLILPLILFAFFAIMSGRGRRRRRGGIWAGPFIGGFGGGFGGGGGWGGGGGGGFSGGGGGFGGGGASGEW